MENNLNALTKEQVKRDKILNGNIWSVVISISAPIFLFNFINAFYIILDTIVVAKISTESVSAVATLHQVDFLLRSLGQGLAAGSGIIVARLYGKGDLDKARKASNQTIFISLIVIFLLLTICIPLAKPLMRMGGASDALISISHLYFILQIINLAFVFLNSVFIALLKAKGSTKLSFVLNLISMAIKLGLSCLFIYGFKVQNIAYLAVATITSQITMLIVFTIVMFKKDNLLQIRFNEFKPEKDLVLQLIKISFPIFLGKFVFSFGKVSVNRICASYGDLVVGALGVSNNLCGLVTTPTNTFEESTSTVVSQNLGNKNLKRAFKSFWVNFILSISISIIGYTLVTFVFRDQLINMFNQTNNSTNTIEFMNLIKNIYRYDSWSIIALAVNSAVLGVLYGFGMTKTTMIINIARVFVFRIPTLLIIKNFFPEIGAEAAGISMGISNIGITIMSILVLVILLIVVKKKGFKDKISKEKVSL